MRNIYQILRERKDKQTTGIIVMDEKGMDYWINFPVYAHLFIKPAYDEINDLEGLIEFVHYFLVEYSETSNPVKKMCLETIIFPLYQQITGRNYDTELIYL